MAVDMEPAVIAGTAPLPAIEIRHAPVPVVYAHAVKQLAACRTIDEAKLGATAADILAAWAAIYRDKTADREARQLKLHAYQRIGVLADQLRPREKAGKGSKGALSLLREHGMNRTHAEAAIKVGRMPVERFRAVVESPRPPSPIALNQSQLRSNPQWATASNRIQMLLPITRQFDPDELVAGLDPGHLPTARSNCAELMAWLEKLQNALSRRKAA